MRLIREYLREIALAFFLLCFLTVGMYWLNFPPQTDYMRFLFILLFTACFLAVLWLISQLWKLKWRRKAAELSQRLFEKISNRLVRFFDKFAFISRRRSNMIFGSTSVSFDHAYERTVKRSGKKTAKWKNTSDDRERLGLLYRYMIVNRIKSGMNARAADTPSELKAKAQNTAPESELFDIYIGTRYDPRREVPAEKVDRLKKTFEREWSIK